MLCLVYHILTRLLSQLPVHLSLVFPISFSVTDCQGTTVPNVSDVSKDLNPGLKKSLKFKLHNLAVQYLRTLDSQIGQLTFWWC